MRSPAPLPTTRGATTACEPKFTFDESLAGLDTHRSPTLSFPCWMVGEGRRHPRLPILFPDQPHRPGEKTDASMLATIASGSSSSSSAAASLAAAGEV